MVRLYWGTGVNDYTDVSESDALAIRYERTVITDHIPHSNHVVSAERGYLARIAFSTFMKTTATRNALLGHLPDVYKVSVDGGTSYRLTTDVGHEVRKEWMDLWPVDLDLLCDADAISTALHSVAGNAATPNAGNRPSSPIFTITVGTQISGLTISDGVRTLVLAGTYAVGHVLVISNWKAMDNADEVTLFMDGSYPQIPAGATTFTFSYTGIAVPATEVAITYRDTWR